MLSMSKLDLKNVTFVCADDIPSHKEIIDLIIKQTTDRIDFGDVVFKDKGVGSIKNYNLFCAKELDKLVKTDYCLVFQWDGYPINVDAWNPEWFKYDYIGAPWLLQPWVMNKTVGNGGFSLRSKRFIEQTAKTEYDGNEAEDVFFCRTSPVDCRFAPVGVAYYFSVEDMPYKGQFGFHGQHTIKINKSLGIF